MSAGRLTGLGAHVTLPTGRQGAFDAVPGVHTVLKYVGSAYILWMAWKIATASGINRAQQQPGRPLTFLQAAGFQWVNPQQPVNKVTRRSAGDPSG